jgi:hypothetical protein
MKQCPNTKKGIIHTNKIYCQALPCHACIDMTIYWHGMAFSFSFGSFLLLFQNPVQRYGF